MMITSPTPAFSLVLRERQTKARPFVSPHPDTSRVIERIPTHLVRAAFRVLPGGPQEEAAEQTGGSEGTAALRLLEELSVHAGPVAEAALWELESALCSFLHQTDIRAGQVLWLRSSRPGLVVDLAELDERPEQYDGRGMSVIFILALALRRLRSLTHIGWVVEVEPEASGDTPDA